MGRIRAAWAGCVGRSGLRLPGVHAWCFLELSLIICCGLFPFVACRRYLCTACPSSYPMQAHSTNAMQITEVTGAVLLSVLEK